MEIDVCLRTEAESLDPERRVVRLAAGAEMEYGALLLATGARPLPLDVAGSTLPHVGYLRTLADCDAIIARARGAERAVVVGASFIGLEAAAALTERGLEVHVVAPEEVPMGLVLGPELGGHLRRALSHGHDGCID
jgi:NADPH-dependent 2,4-dienoyl-CoA reductase/sulfur reductase-like enzyme